MNIEISSIGKMVVLYYVFTLLIYFTNAQFPDHIDLQKINEVSYKNENYNILKPTVHKITDYFEQFMLRTESRKNEKIFIDNDGFRHFWSGLGLKAESLRKTDFKLYEINKEIQANAYKDDDETSEELSGIPIERAGINAKAATTKHTTAKPKPATTKPKPATNKPKPATTKPKPTTTKPAAVTTKPTVAGKPQATAAKTKLNLIKPKKVAITTFFCPFLGVIKMTTAID